MLYNNVERGRKWSLKGRCEQRRRALERSSRNNIHAPITRICFTLGARHWQEQRGQSAPQSSEPRH